MCFYPKVHRSGPNDGVELTQLVIGNTLVCLHVNEHEHTIVKEFTVKPLTANCFDSGIH